MPCLIVITHAFIICGIAECGIAEYGIAEYGTDVPVEDLNSRLKAVMEFDGSS